MSREDMILESIAEISETCGPDEYEIAMGILCDLYGTEYIAELIMS
ncbi:MAG: hypothetical protein NC548_22970 [Lachnospiraceae bacterium]|nr:hypothetical protein [Lachnospiraceae bacterium]